MSPKGFFRQLTPEFLLSWYHLTLAFLAALWYRFPSESMTVIGVTGTKGKSTTVFMLAKILEVAGKKVAVSSSLMFKIRENEWLNPYRMTMAGRFRLQEFLAQARDAGCTHVIIETTSQGIAQHRHRFINFDMAVWTNLAPEHIEAHGGFEQYKRAKGKLFAALRAGRRKTIAGTRIEKVSVVNSDDEQAPYFAAFPADKKYGFSLRGACAFAVGAGECFSAQDAKTDPEEGSFILGGASFSLKLLGVFNIANAVCAAVAANALGVEFSVSARALSSIEEVPGRMKFVREGQKFAAIVDYAHTPESYESVLAAAAPLRKQNGRVLAVCGSAGGGRDAWKRKEIGAIIARHADYIILTAEDPYNEDPATIAAAIQEGITAQGFRGTLETILDRRAAIHRAVNVARWNDVVLFLGKGSEQTMAVGDDTLPWNEEGIVIEEIRNMLYDRK